MEGGKFSLTILICLMHIIRSHCMSASLFDNEEKQKLQELRQADDAECCEDNCASYRGNLATTISGKDCIPWANLYSGDHWTAAKNPDSGLNSNYCRNPSNHVQTWCYVKRKGGAVWENCAMRPCKHIPDNGDADNDGDRGTDGKGGDEKESPCCDDKCASYRGNLAKTSSGKDCIPWKILYVDDHWTPAKNPKSGLESNYCRNPSGHSQAWCYVMRKRGVGAQWENCDVDMRPCKQ